MRVDGVGHYDLLGETLDDAAGEAFDKTAKLLGLGYPGGPATRALAEAGHAGRIKLPRPMLAAADLDFSFSGLKTAVVTQVKTRAMEREQTRADIAARIRGLPIVDVLVAKSLAALEQRGVDHLVVAGGVGANRAIARSACTRPLPAKGFSVYYPGREFCTDNGAMIAFAAAMRLEHATRKRAATRRNVLSAPRWNLAALAG